MYIYITNYFSTTWTSKGCRPGAVVLEIAVKTVAVPVLEVKVAK